MKRTSREPIGFRLVDSGLLPDRALRAVVWARVRIRSLRRPRAAATRAALVAELCEQNALGPVTAFVDEANAQHYEVPTRFFELVLGPRLKYSSGCWPPAVRDLAGAEDAMLAITAERLGLDEGQDVLDLGCGWGSFTLWAAPRFATSRFLAVSNSATQREFIEARAASLGLTNVEVQTIDVAQFEPPRRFHRVVSVEMFEHVVNHRELLRRISTWLRPDGALLVHVCSHVDSAWRFDPNDRNDWVARYFFAGGLLPSHDLLLHEQRDLRVERVWRLPGTHYARTLDAWLARMDEHEPEIRRLFAERYGSEADAWWNRWRTFFIVCSEMCSVRIGEEYGISHYRFVQSGPGEAGAGSVRRNE